MTADERINALLARAGKPVMLVCNAQEDENGSIMRAAHRVALRDFGGSIALYIRHLLDTIDRLEAALSNVINEREQLKRDLHEAAAALCGTSTCKYCANEEKAINESPCDQCVKDWEKPCFEWRGIPESEAEHGEV